MDKKEQQAIDFLRSMERDDPMCLGFPVVKIALLFSTLQNVPA